MFLNTVYFDHILSPNSSKILCTFLPAQYHILSFSKQKHKNKTKHKMNFKTRNINKAKITTPFLKRHTHIYTYSQINIHK